MFCYALFFGLAHASLDSQQQQQQQAAQVLAARGSNYNSNSNANTTKVITTLDFGRSFAALTALDDDGERVLISGGQRTRVFSTQHNSSAGSEDDSSLFAVYDTESRRVSELQVEGLPTTVSETLWSHAALLDPDRSRNRLWILHASGVAYIDLESNKWHEIENAPSPASSASSSSGLRRWFYFGACFGTGRYASWIFAAGGNVHTRGQWLQKRLFAAFDTEKLVWHDLSSSPSSLGGGSAYDQPADGSRHWIPHDRASMVRSGSHLVLYTVSELWAFNLEKPATGWTNLTGTVVGDSAAPPAFDRETNLEREKVPYLRPRIFAGMAKIHSGVLLYGGLAPTGRALLTDLWLLSTPRNAAPSSWSWRLVVSQHFHPKDDHNPFRRWGVSLAFLRKEKRALIWGGVSGFGMGMGRVGSGDGDSAVRELDLSSPDPEMWNFVRVPLPEGQVAEDTGGHGNVDDGPSSEGGTSGPEHNEELDDSSLTDSSSTTPRKRSRILMYSLVIIFVVALLAICVARMYRDRQGRMQHMQHLHRVPSRVSRIVPTKISFVASNSIPSSTTGGQTMQQIGGTYGASDPFTTFSSKRRGSDSSVASSSADSDLLINAAHPPTPKSGTPVLNVGGSPLRGLVGRAGAGGLNHLYRAETGSGFGGQGMTSPGYYVSPRSMDD